MEHTLGEWSTSINAFWYGANGTEWVAWKGSNQVFEYPCDGYPSPPIAIIQHDKRIETIEDFTNAMYNGKYYKAEYKKDIAYWQEEVIESDYDRTEI